MVNGQTKGKTFERSVAEGFANWWGCSLRRSPNSGAWDKIMAPGDLIENTNTARIFPFTVECKNQMGWSLDDFLYQGAKSKVSRFLHQCWGDAQESSMIPILAMKRAFKPPIVVIRTKDFPPHVKGKLDVAVTTTAVTDEMCHILFMSDFFSYDPKYMAKVLLELHQHQKSKVTARILSAYLSNCPIPE